MSCSTAHQPGSAMLQLLRSAGARPFRTASGEAFIAFRRGNHRETWSLRDPYARSWLMTLYFDSYGALARPDAVRDALAQLNALAMIQEKPTPVGLRVAEHTGSIFIDLGDSTWAAIKISPDGWQEVAEPPVMFRRASGMLPLPSPQRGGTVDLLRPFINLESTDDFKLVVGWLLGALHPRGPYPVLVLTGEQGTAKTTVSRLLRRLIDPNSADVRALPNSTRDLAIMARNAHVVAFDNISVLPTFMSDAISRLATGGATTPRQLYTNEREMLLDAVRPAILNGIDDFVTRSDLAERSLFVSPARILPQHRQTERQFWSQFDAQQPLIFGALLDALVHGLRNLGKVVLPQHPRMADFAEWAAACEGAFNWPAGAFADAYARNQDDVARTVIEADAVASVLRAFTIRHSKWCGTATDLLTELDRLAPKRLRDRAWPKNAQGLSQRLRRIAPEFRKFGVEITHERAPDPTRRRFICISRVGSEA